MSGNFCEFVPPENLRSCRNAARETEGSGPVGSVNAGTTSSSNALAVDVGGGLDVRLNHRFAIRAFRASYLRTQFPNSTTNAQNSLSVGAGLVVRFGK